MEDNIDPCLEIMVNIFVCERMEGVDDVGNWIMYSFLAIQKFRKRIVKILD